MTICRTYRGWSYVTDYFIITLSDAEVTSMRDLILERRGLKLRRAILDDLMNLYARDRFHKGQYT